MNTKELMEKYTSLYDYMSRSRNPEYMKTFGRVMTHMVEDIARNDTAKAEEYIERLESIKWDNYLTPAEAETIVAEMSPKAPWTREQWRSAMEQKDYALEKEPYYNKCALWVTMNMIMSDSGGTIAKYVSSDKMFDFVHDVAIDKLCDEDANFMIRLYFNV